MNQPAPRLRRALRVLASLVIVMGSWSLAAIALGGAGGDGRADVYGIWASSGTMIEVKSVGGSLSARIIALKHPDWREKDEKGEVGEPKTDLYNSDASQHGRPLIGLEMLGGYQYRKGKWRGQLYLPSNGTDWTSTVRLKKGELLIRGYAGVPIFGKTQVFAPLSACNDDILRMIENAGIKDTPCSRVTGQ